MGDGAETFHRLRQVICDLYGCDSTHVASVPITECLDGQTWQGTVEVFCLIGHPQATTVYAWSRDAHESLYATVLALDPIATPVDAVRADLAADIAIKGTKR